MFNWVTCDGCTRMDVTDYLPKLRLPPEVGASAMVRIVNEMSMHYACVELGPDVCTARTVLGNRKGHNGGQ